MTAKPTRLSCSDISSASLRLLLEFRHRAVCAIADHERDARFGGACLGQQAERDHQTNSEAPDRGAYTHDRRRIG